VELTFFPDDVIPGPFLRRNFIEWAQQMQTHLGARRYYTRYENASWQFGDTGAQSGVFLVSDDPGLVQHRIVWRLSPAREVICTHRNVGFFSQQIEIT
jgi:hypothetical protein